VSEHDAAQDSGSRHGDTEAQAEADSDALITSYRTILNELALLTTVSVLLFGFLLSNAGRFADSTGEEWISAIATVLVASATLVFILPVAYHHLQFPYRDFAKFQARSHRWVLFGVPLLAAGLYLSLCLALWSLFGAWAIVVAGMPIMAAAVFFVLRKGQL
jgi:hypothetical protein